MISHTEENYLKAMFGFMDEQGEITVNELSKHLSIKMPTVNGMMKRLSEKGLVHYESYKPLKLTEEGKKLAALVIRKHRLTEMYLVEKMGFGWEEVHIIAEQIEHIQSPEFFDKMDELLGYPQHDPHGSPIPDKGGKIKSRKLVRLAECAPEDTVILAAIADSSEELLKFLNHRNLKLGTELTVESIESFDKSMVIKTSTDKSQVLSNLVTEKLLMEKE
ncbi:metal-dependent transcriptional regulator [Sphingobacterium chuzhouense]|uniref:Transcriptional regulator MntR n=1 Tax=Sphingobacterium chuzhouense TaxID=1742264 RepID=A0ABR7XP83_9SPHI|nr:metal-dependent transcriptional regulator [Sphingobacterium chuzhouense]MBD1420980.1 metal-dependent transcriptional regulator [Sphingobacterium chuzhouense]